MELDLSRIGRIPKRQAQNSIVAQCKPGCEICGEIVGDLMYAQRHSRAQQSANEQKRMAESAEAQT